MKSFKHHLSEQVRIDSIESLLVAIDGYRKTSEIVNPEYVRLTDSAKRLFKKVSDQTQNHALDALWAIRIAKEDETVVSDFYYSISDSLISLGKLSKMVEKNKSSKNQHIKSVIAEVNKMISVWKPIADDLKSLKTKVVKVTQKRIEAKTVAATAMSKKFFDSSSLIKIFEDHLEEYKKVAKERSSEFIKSRLEILKNAGWDLTIAVPKSKNDSKMYEAKRAFYNTITKSTVTSRRFDDPDIREPNNPLIAHRISQDVKSAEDDYRAFMQKMIEKIGKPVVSAKMTGSIWTNALITVETNDGEEQIWNTQMIINFSKYQKMYNQFPSRRKKSK